MAEHAPITRRIFGGAAATVTGAAIVESRGRVPDDHIRERRDPDLPFDPDVWLDELKAMGGNVWFTMDPTWPKGPDDGGFFRHYKLAAFSEAHRAAIFRAMVLREARKIALGIDNIRDKPEAA